MMPYPTKTIHELKGRGALEDLFSFSIKSSSFGLRAKSFGPRKTKKSGRRTPFVSLSIQG